MLKSAGGEGNNSVRSVRSAGLLLFGTFGHAFARGRKQNRRTVAHTRRFPAGGNGGQRGEAALRQLSAKLKAARVRPVRRLQRCAKAIGHYGAAV